MANTKYDLQDIEQALRDELRDQWNQSTARFPGEDDMIVMFLQDYQDGCQVASYIARGEFVKANDYMSGMDTAARETVAEAIVRVNRQFFVDHIMGEEWKHPDQWCR